MSEVRQTTVEEAVQQELGERIDPAGEAAGSAAGDLGEADLGEGMPPPWYLAESPDVKVEDYLNHPLNWAESRGLARALRGMEGLVGSLRYAVVDLVVGLVEFWWREARPQQRREVEEDGDSA